MRVSRYVSLSMALLLGAIVAGGARAQAAPDSAPAHLDIYGFVQLDMGDQIGRINPQWYDVVRPSKLPSSASEFQPDGQFFASVRQTRFGVQAWAPTKMGELWTVFEFDMFGVGADAGQTTIRLRKAWAQLGKIGAGQMNSTFMDIDVFPNTFEYWGPDGMIFYRNIQVRYMAIQGPSFLNIALENPGASADQGIYADRVELSGVVTKFPLPDLTAQYRSAQSWGYLQFGGVVRKVQWIDENATPSLNLSGSAVGWGLTASSNIKFDKGNDVVRLQGVYGKGIQNYMNDAPVDIGIQNNFSNSYQPVLGVPLPMWSMVAFLDHAWNDQWMSSIGYSTLVVTNSDGQAPDAFHSGAYGAVNIVYNPVKNVYAALEYTFGQRKNNSDGWSYNDNRIAVSFKYAYSQTIGGTK